MKVKTTEQTIEIVLSVKEIKNINAGETLVGKPTTEFLSPLGNKMLIVRKWVKADEEIPVV